VRKKVCFDEKRGSWVLAAHAVQGGREKPEALHHRKGKIEEGRRGQKREGKWSVLQTI